MKKQKEEQTDIVYGINPVLELLKARKRKIVSCYTVRPAPREWPKIEEYRKKLNFPVNYVARDVLHRLAQTIDHQGVVCYCQPFVFRKIPFNPKTHPFVVLLDGIQDPRNLGAIIRSAYCTGVSGIIITKKQSAPLNGTALKTSAGLAEYTDIYESPSLNAALQELKKAGYSLYMAGFGGENALSVIYKRPLCLVIGSEGSGISPSLIKEGTLVTIPQRAADISYNASVAAAIMMCHIANAIER